MLERKTIIPEPREIAPIEALVIDYLINEERGTADQFVEIQLEISIDNARDIRDEFDIPRIPPGVDYNLLF